MRKLASIQKIVSLEAIKDADKIEKCTVLGWTLVVAKQDNFKVGDKIVFMEVDSILPPKPEFEFLRERKFRIKTIKLRGQISQGICFPLSILPKGKYIEGDDVTEILGLRKHDPQAEFERKESDRLASLDKNRMTKFLKRYAWYRRLVFKPNRISFPSFVRKTDEDRIQLFPDVCERWKDTPFYVTEKLDGQSATYFMIPNPKRGLFRKKWLFGVCSRNFQLLKPDNSSYWRLAKERNIENKMKAWCDINNKGLIIQGEAVGVGIQGNKYGFNGLRLFIFNVFTYYKGQTTSLDQDRQESFCADMNLKTVDRLMSNFILKSTIPEMVEHAKGISLRANIHREGIVVRNYEHNISFKVVNSDFILKYQDE